MKRLFVSAAAIALAGCAGEEQATTEADADASAPSEEAAPASDAVRSLRLYALQCGQVYLGDMSMYGQGDEYAGRQSDVGTPCFLIRHPDGDLVWDAGLPDMIAQQEDGVRNGPFHLTVPVSLASQMETLGLAPSDIEYFSISHSHFDHVGNASTFAGSTFLVNENERAFMFRDEARADEHAFPLVAALEDAETIEFTGDYDVFGDGSVMILSTPGHTPGHGVLKLELANAGPVLLTGDLYHMHESRELRTVPKFNTDLEQTFASMDRFEAVAAETGARVIIQHSLEDFAELPQVPEYLD